MSLFGVNSMNINIRNFRENLKTVSFPLNAGEVQRIPSVESRTGLWNNYPVSLLNCMKLNFHQVGSRLENLLLLASCLFPQYEELTSYRSNENLDTHDLRPSGDDLALSSSFHYLINPLTLK